MLVGEDGVFHLIDPWREASKEREVFKFKLVAVEGEEDFSQPIPSNPKERSIILTLVKLEVLKKDGGKFTNCGSEVDLPVSKDRTERKIAETRVA